MMTRADIAPLAALARDVAAHLDRAGVNAWNRTKADSPGTSAQALTGSRNPGGISDPTGTAAINSEYAYDPHRELRTHLERVRAALIDLNASLTAAVPNEPRVCWWLAQVGASEPAPRTINGRPASRWVYDHWNQTGRFPTSEQLRLRAAGRNVPRTKEPAT
ncbi:MAG: hypothetical protein ABL886_05695 [Rhodoglobus sp.]